MNSPYVRIVLAILVGALVGYSAAVAPDYYQQWQDNRALLADMATNPVYQMIAEIEAANPNIVVLKSADTGKGQSILWIFHKQANVPEGEEEAYFLDLLSLLFGTLYEYMPGQQYYTLAFTTYRSVATTEGTKTQVIVISDYTITATGLETYFEEPTIDTLNVLVSHRLLQVQYLGFYGITVADILPREPGYIWPWDMDSGCDTCQ